MPSRARLPVNDTGHRPQQPLDALPARAGTTPVSAGRFLVSYTASILLLWTLSRGLQLSLTSDRWNAAVLPQLLWTGLRVDLIGVGITIALPVLIWPLLAHPSTANAWWRTSRAWIGAILLLALVLELMTPVFLAQYESRPNHLAVEYLRDWRSVLPMLWVGFKLPLLTATAILLAGLFALGRWLATDVPGHPALRAPIRLAILALWPLLIAADVLLIRGSLDHRPANPSLFAQWSDHLLNQLALNSTYSFSYALYAQRHERSAAEVYGAIADADLVAALRRDPRFAASPPERPTWHAQRPAASRPHPLNLIIVVEESLGADFSARLGGQGLTPELDRWSSHGIWFEQLYATGTRSARGLEAIIAGFPPSPAPAVLKREAAQEGFATLAGVLHGTGYRSRFIYGGAAHFDNMRGFFLGNGFDEVIEQRDFTNPSHVSSWGVSDEDLFERTLAETDAAHARGERYFHLVFTSSHHEPFDIPPGRLPPALDAPGTPAAAVRYADFALGRFLDGAATRPWFDDTLVLVVADHDVRVYGDEVIPLRRFQIPGLIVGAETRPLSISSLASQIDLAPTLLSLMGVAAHTPFPGRDLTTNLEDFGASRSAPQRALMQFDERFAWLLPGELRVLHPGGRAERWMIEGADHALRPGAPLTSDEHRALQVEALLGDWLYRRRAYGLAAAD